MWEAGLESAEAFAKRLRVTQSQARALQCTAEHLHARCDGGTNHAANLAAACLWCNSLRHKRPAPPDPASYAALVRSRVKKRRWHSRALWAALDRIGSTAAAP